MKTKTLLLALLLLAGLAKPLAGPLEADVQLTYPLTVKKLENIYIDARLYEYDPWLADVSATLVDHVCLRTSTSAQRSIHSWTSIFRPSARPG